MVRAFNALMVLAATVFAFSCSGKATSSGGTSGAAGASGGSDLRMRPSRCAVMTCMRFDSRAKIAATLHEILIVICPSSA
jgi:hypothetical protein